MLFMISDPCRFLLSKFFLVWLLSTQQRIFFGESTSLRHHALQRAGDQAYLDEGESNSGHQRLAFMLHLISHILLQSFILIDLPLLHHVEEGARGHGNGDSITGFGLYVWMNKTCSGSCVCLLSHILYARKCLNLTHKCMIIKL